MNLSAVLAEIDGRLATITGLRHYVGFPGKITAPAAVVYPPDRIDYDQTYGRGVDTLEDLVVVVFVRNSTPRAALAAILPYLDGSGTKSIKAKLDATAAAPYASCSDVTVGWSQLDPGAVIGGGSYLAAHFHCKIIGPGA